MNILMNDVNDVEKFNKQLDKFCLGSSCQKCIFNKSGSGECCMSYLRVMFANIKEDVDK